MISLLIYLIGYFFQIILTFSAGDIHLEKWPYFCFAAIKFILTGLEDVLNKLLLTEKNMLPHVLMFLRGLYNSGMAIVLAIIIKFSEIEFDFSSNNFIFSKFLIPTLILFVANLFSMFVNYTFTPQHLSFLNLIFLLFFLLFYRISKHYSAVIIICEIIIDLFLIFSTIMVE